MAELDGTHRNVVVGDQEASLRGMSTIWSERLSFYLALSYSDFPSAPEKTEKYEREACTPFRESTQNE
jgi:hypothetical protein